MKNGLTVVVVNDGGVPLFLANFPEGLLCPMPRLPLMVRAAQLRRSCDGVAAATELRRPAPSRSFCASRLDVTRRMRPAFIFPRVDLDINGRGP